jgi:hypothetical protein
MWYLLISLNGKAKIVAGPHFSYEEALEMAKLLSAAELPLL